MATKVNRKPTFFVLGFLAVEGVVLWLTTLIWHPIMMLVTVQLMTQIFILPLMVIGSRGLFAAGTAFTVQNTHMAEVGGQTQVVGAWRDTSQVTFSRTAGIVATTMGTVLWVISVIGSVLVTHYNR